MYFERSQHIIFQLLPLLTPMVIASGGAAVVVVLLLLVLVTSNGAPTGLHSVLK